LNRKRVSKHFPEVHTCACNAFLVEKGSKAYGFHHASSAGYEYGFLYKHGVFAPEHHKSFHTAVTATNFSANPFAIFEDAVPEVFNTHWVAKHFQTIESSIPVETMKLVNAASVMYLEMVSATHMRVLQDYLHVIYYATKACGNASEDSVATYWDLEPGQALHFNNWRVHSDSELGTADYDRVTMDLRCFSEQKVPLGFRDSYDYIQTVAPHLVNSYNTITDCLLQLFNYSDSGEFLKTVFG